MNAWGYKDYEPVSIKKARAARSLEKLKKKNAQLSPVRVAGRKLAGTWWGIAWNENLERYADYANRIDRGRSYVRQGAVLDLQIEPGKVFGLVQGSRVNPYKVEITIQPLKPATWKTIVQACTGNIHSLQDLISGKFPKNLAELFTVKGAGLFPTPREIELHCSCPDWADMCKHVAAVLYGIGARFDEDPTLFFRLRQVNFDDLITSALNQTSDTLLDRSAQKSRRSLDHDDLSGLFGIDLSAASEAGPESVPKKPAQVKPARANPVREEPVAAESIPTERPPTGQLPEAGAKKRGRPRKAAAGTDTSAL